MVFALKMTMEVPTFAFVKWAGKVNLAINVCHIGIARFKIKLLVSVGFTLKQINFYQGTEKIYFHSNFRTKSVYLYGPIKSTLLS